VLGAVSQGTRAVKPHSNKIFQFLMLGTHYRCPRAVSWTRGHFGHPCLRVADMAHGHKCPKWHPRLWAVSMTHAHGCQKMTPVFMAHEHGHHFSTPMFTGHVHGRGHG